jgi:hypothetical protein
MDVPLNKVALALTLAASVVSALCWVMSARAEVRAKPGTAGVGALLGGDIVIKNASGQRIDLIDTMAMQSKWNRWAAIFAALATSAQVLTVVPI